MSDDGTRSASPGSDFQVSDSPVPIPTKASRKKAEKAENEGPVIPKAEREGRTYCLQLLDHIKKHNGIFVRHEDGSVHLIIAKRRVRLDFDYANHPLANLMLAACNVTTLSSGARAAIQRLQVHANQKSGKIRLRHFSALSDNNKRLHIPLESGELLSVSADEIKKAVNGNSQDSVWLEHPEGDPLKYVPTVDIKAGLQHFERLLVDTQATRKPEIRWFVAMHEGFFPFVRDLCPARLIVVHQGDSQQGKTSGARRFVLLHGLGDVSTDWTPAALGNSNGPGLLVLDNKEQANLTQPIIDYLLFVSTGGRRGRSSVDGVVRLSNQSRPAVVITTIEGVYKTELENRCVEVPYAVSGNNIPLAPIQEEIQQRRNEIVSAMVPVLQCFLRIRKELKSTPNPRPEFEEHFVTLCDLLRAFGEVAQKPQGWSEKIIHSWAKILGKRPVEEHELERPLLEILEDGVAVSDMAPLSPTRCEVTVEDLVDNGQQGKLYVTTVGYLHSELQKKNRTDIKNAAGLGKRLNASRKSFLAFRIMNEESNPEMLSLRRTAKKQPIGFFVVPD